MWRYPLAVGLILAGMVLLALGRHVGGAAFVSHPEEAEPGRTVVLRVDGRILGRLTVRSPFPADALTQAHVPWFPGDEVRLNGELWQPERPWPADLRVALLDVRRARLWRWRTADGQQQGQVRLAATSAAEALVAAGVPLHPADGLRRNTDDVWVWVPAQQVTVRTPAGEYQARVVARTVGQTLAAANIPLIGLDQAVPAEFKRVPAEETIPLEVQWVEEVLVAHQESIPYESETRAMPDWPLDQVQVVQEGRPGVRVRWERVRRVNGEEVERQLAGRSVLQPPQPRVVGYGTQVVIRTLNTPAGPVRYWRAVPVYATSYSPCRVGGGRCSATTASGEPLQKGVVAVRLSWYRSMQGLTVYIPGYGYGRILDVGGGIPGRYWIDLGYSDDDYVSWHQWTTLYFVAPPPPPEQILYLLP